MVEIEFSENMNAATFNFLRRLAASDPPAVDALIHRAYDSLEKDLSRIDDCETCVEACASIWLVSYEKPSWPGSRTSIDSATT